MVLDVLMRGDLCAVLSGPLDIYDLARCIAVERCNVKALEDGVKFNPEECHQSRHCQANAID